MSTLKNFKEFLKDKGVIEEDIEMSAKIAKRIKVLDNIIFPKKPAHIDLSIIKSDFGHLVAYFPGEAQYIIYLDGIAEVFERMQKIKRFWLYSNNFLQYGLNIPTLEELLISIASHEIRHRIQYQFSVKKFSSESINDIKDNYLKAIVEFIALAFEKKYQSCIKKHKTEEYINDRINNNEFDAEVVEFLFINSIRQNPELSYEEIALLLKLEAP